MNYLENCVGLPEQNRSRGFLNNFRVGVIILALSAAPALAQQTFTLNGLSSEDVLVIGAGLDKLPRETTDRNNLYQRLQAQITQQNQAAAKAQADAQKAAIDKAIADAKAEKPKAEEPQP